MHKKISTTTLFRNNLLFTIFSTLTTFCSTFPRPNNLKSGKNNIQHYYSSSSSPPGVRKTNRVKAIFQKSILVTPKLRDCIRIRLFSNVYIQICTIISEIILDMHYDMYTNFIIESHYVSNFCLLSDINAGSDPENQRRKSKVQVLKSNLSK